MIVFCVGLIKGLLSNRKTLQIPEYSHIVTGYRTDLFLYTFLLSKLIKRFNVSFCN